MTPPAARALSARWRSPRHAPLVLGSAAGVAALLVFHGPKWSAVAHALTGVSWSWAAVAVGLNLASAIARGLAWRTVVVQAIPKPHPRHLDLFSAFFVGIFANGVLPGRVGEVARVGVLARRLPRRRGLWPALLGSVAAHRLLEIVPSFALIAWVLLAATIPRWAFAALLSVLVGGSLLFVLGVVGARGREHVSRLETLGPVRAAATMVRTGLGILRAGVSGSTGEVVRMGHCPSQGARAVSHPGLSGSWVVHLAGPFSREWADCRPGTLSRFPQITTVAIRERAGIPA